MLIPLLDQILDFKTGRSKLWHGTWCSALNGKKDKMSVLCLYNMLGQRDIQVWQHCKKAFIWILLLADEIDLNMILGVKSSVKPKQTEN